MYSKYEVLIAGAQIHIIWVLLFLHIVQTSRIQEMKFGLYNV